MGAVKRRYRSPKRRQQAEATRGRILASARALFLSRGYGKTTIRAIADGAGVAAQTVYAALGSKRGILMGLLDEMASDADVTRMQAAVEAASGDPQRQLRERIAFNVRFYAAGADLIETARTVSGAEPDLGAMWREGEARRHRATSALVAEWARARVLAPGLTARQAVDVMWALSGPDLFRLFVVERGWAGGRYEKWLRGTLERLLFAEA
jgi:TetR/AcrR family transcriptional regulator, regulator of autoinduction and epiphytic fitness